MFEFSKEAREYIEFYQQDMNLNDNDMKLAIDSLEQLLSLKTEEQTDFTSEYGEQLDKALSVGRNIDPKGLCCIKDFLKKLLIIRGKSISEVDDSLESLYRAATDCDANAAKEEEAFQTAYQYHQCTTSEDASLPNGRILNDYLTNQVIVYLSVCFKNSEVIRNRFTEEKAKNAIDISDYCKNCLKAVRPEDKKVIDENYLQLNWKKSNVSNNSVSRTIEQCIAEKRPVKLLGNPGAGKTTMLLKLYIDDLKKNIESAESIPVWISLKDAKNYNGNLIQEIKKVLGNVDDATVNDYINNGILHLYLDGYNELLSLESRSNVSSWLDYQRDNIPIIVSDRTEYTEPVYLPQSDCFSADPFITRESHIEYHKKYCDESQLQQIEEYYDDDNFDSWISEESFVPFMLNILREMVLDGCTPSDVSEYYKTYLERLLKRERQKGETGINTLMNILQAIAQSDFLGDENKPWTINDISSYVKLQDLKAIEERVTFGVQMGILSVVKDSIVTVYQFSNPTYFKNIKG